MKKGFTLIELLAVIVILAIIALIATPIVINIIEDSKKSATLRSADFYLDGVEYAISKRVLDRNRISNGTYNIIEGNICLDYEEKCKDILKVEVKGEKPTSGNITLEDGQIKDIYLTYTDKNIIFNNKGELAYALPVCTLVENGDVGPTGISVGDKYQCKVKDNMETGFEDGYYFFVLGTNDDGTTNLIMERNIYYDSINNVGLVATSTNTGEVAWNSLGDNSFGPVTAMDYLYNATKDWNNIPNISIDYTDEENKYGSITTINNVTKITKKDNTAVTVLTDKEGYTNLKARMPEVREILDADYLCGTGDEDCSLYLLNYLNFSGCEFVYGEGLQNIDEIAGYWTLSSHYFDSEEAFLMVPCTNLHYTYVQYSDFVGVRPVITLKI